MSGPWEAVIGLEAHVQLATRSKIFSGAAAAFGGAPNSQACPVDLGLPGALPVLNEAAVRMAVLFGMAIGAAINRRSVFERKNYFYPDLPKGYQISQFQHPIVGRGKLEVPLDDGGVLQVGIVRAHLEEDAGKSLHDAYPGRTGIDLNRAGTPRLEVVSDPDLRSPEQAAAYFRQLHSLVRHLKICDGDLSQGSMRCDANVSVRPLGDARLGERTEIKNLNSFRFLEKAVRHEIRRQIDLLEAGRPVPRDTRLYDPERNETRPMRGKEHCDDYRYFPDPDLLPVVLDEAFLASVRRALPELPGARRQRFCDQFGLSGKDAARLVRDPVLADYFETVAGKSGDAKLAVNWATGALARNLNRSGLTVARSPVTADHLAQLIRRIRDGTLSNKTAQTVFDALWQREGDVDQIIAARRLQRLSDRSALESLIAQLVAEHPAQAAQFRAGKGKLLGFFVGRIMQATQGRADPKQVNALLADALQAGGEAQPERRKTHGSPAN